jgi:hypothetical protein
MLVNEYRPPKATALIPVVYGLCERNAVNSGGSTAESPPTQYDSEADTTGCETRDRSQVPSLVLHVHKK